MKKLSLGLKLKKILGLKDKNQAFFEDLEDILIQADIGISLCMEIVDTLKEQINKNKKLNQDQIMQILGDMLKQYVITKNIQPQKNELNIFLVLGVNGVGKTTTIAKLSDFFRAKFGLEKILLCAADTFRAAAIEQLMHHGKKLNLKVIHQQQGSDPGAVVFDAMSSALAQQDEIIFIDTAGRMHNKSNLVRELAKIDKIIKARLQNGLYHKLLIIDATTGQNAFKQAEIFNEAVEVDSIVMAKYDASAKGGIVLKICKELGIPFSFVGTGEKLDNISTFNREEYINSILGITE